VHYISNAYFRRLAGKEEWETKGKLVFRNQDGWSVVALLRKKKTKKRQKKGK